MAYYITVHYPMSMNEQDSAWKYWIFLKKYRKLSDGDRIFIYETESNPSYIEGDQTIVRPPGKKAVIALVRMKGELKPHDGGPEVLDDGRVHDWKFVAETKLEKECYIPLDELRQSLEKPGWCARVSGGLMEISPDQFNWILAKLTSSI